MTGGHESRAASNARLSNFIHRIEVLSPSERTCLMYFKNLYVRHGVLVYPALATVAKEIRVSVRTVRRHMRLLCKLGALTVHKQGGEKGDSRMPTVYTFNEVRVLELAYLKRTEPRTQTPDTTPDNLSAYTGNPGHDPGQPRTICPPNLNDGTDLSLRPEKDPASQQEVFLNHTQVSWPKLPSGTLHKMPETKQ